MAVSRYKNFRQVKSFPTDPRRLETFPSIGMNDLLSIPHTIIKFKESDRLDHLAERFLGNATYWWAICLMNDLDNPFSYKLLPGFLLKIPNTMDSILSLIQLNKGSK